MTLPIRRTLISALLTFTALAQQPTPSEMPQEMVWVDRSGKILGRVGATQNSIFFPEISPDGRFIAVSARDGEPNDRDIWIHEVSAGTKRVLAPAKGNDNFPLWSPDGKEIIFTSSRAGGNYDLMRKRVDSDAPETVILKLDTADYPRSWSPDGKTLLFTRSSQSRALFTLNLGNPDSLRPLFPTNEKVWNEGARYSPDGRWIAYVSNAGGPFEVYVADAAAPERSWKVSRELANGWAGGGGQPRWSADGSQLYYMMGSDTMLSVQVDASGAQPKFSPPKRLFAILGMRGNFPEEAPWLTRYDVTKDGQRFVFVRTVAK
ncbi:MAG: PD40 domain-containing protein [Bdellovibrionales bacterium]|nr:PD40 domain-containing protein [Bdellovibrionales bacterium]